MSKRSSTFFKGFCAIALIALVFILPGCGSGGSKGGVTEITVKYNYQNIKPFADLSYKVDYSIIPLELPYGENIRIYLNNIEVFENRIYVSTLRESIYIFDTNGYLVSKISKGEELAELESLTDFMINRQERVLEVFDSKRLCRYDLEGRFIDSQELKGILGTEYGVIGNNRIYLRHKNSLSEHTFTVTPGNKNFEWKTGQTMSNILNPKHFHSYNNALYFTGYSDKVYRLEANDSIPQIIATVTHMHKDNNVKGLDNARYEALSAQKKLFTYINNFFVYNDDLWAFSLHAGEYSEKIFLDRTNGNYYSHPLTGVPYSQNNRWVENGTEYYLFPASKFEESSNTIKNVAPELHKAMEEAPSDCKMWIIKATYTKK